MTEGPIIIKLGGSAITNKDKFKSPRLNIIKQLAREIGQIYEKLEKKIVIIHGGGSYGHPLASKFKLHMGLKDANALLGVSETIDAMRELSLLISQNLRENGVPVAPIQPSSIAINKSSKIHYFNMETIVKFLDLNMTPLLWGDVVYDLNQGVSILSGDELVSYIAIKLNAKMVVYGSDVDGIYREPRNKKGLIRLVNDRNLQEVLNHIIDTQGVDVTGGMRRKIEEILKVYEQGIPIYLVNATKNGYVYRTVKSGEVLGTLFYKHGV